MLLIDGVKYELWAPSNEDEFEQIVKEHAQEIFGQQSIYIDRKQKLKSLSGIGSIPDGYVIVHGERPQWHIVEVELSSHPLHEHIVAQVGKFITGINNPNIQRGIVSNLYSEIINDDFLKLKLEKAIKPQETYHYLDDLISRPPVLTIIIERDTQGLRDVLRTLAHPQIKVVEFQTFRRAGAEAVQAHLFEPLYPGSALPYSSLAPAFPAGITKRIDYSSKIAGRVTFEELVGAGLLRDGQFLYFYNTRPFADERAQVMASSNQLKYAGDSHAYSKSKLAKILLKKHGFKHDDLDVQGPKYWKTEDGKLLQELEEQIRSRRGDRK